MYIVMRWKMDALGKEEPIVYGPFDTTEDADGYADSLPAFTVSDSGEEQEWMSATVVISPK